MPFRDGRFGYVPIYGNTWVGKPGSNGSTVHVVDLRGGRTVAVIDLGKEVRPHCVHFGPDGLLPRNSPMLFISWTQRPALSSEKSLPAQHTPISL